MNDDSSNWIDRLLGGGNSIADTFNSVERLFEVLSDPQTYFRAFMVVFGFVIIIAAIRY